jgi:hypothetical protein
MTEMMGNGLLVGIHMMLGMILVAGGVLGVATALPNGRQATACAVVALVGILAAGLGGLAFLMGGQSNGASYPRSQYQCVRETPKSSLTL